MSGNSSCALAADWRPEIIANRVAKAKRAWALASLGRQQRVSKLPVRPCDRIVGIVVRREHGERIDLVFIEPKQGSGEGANRLQR